MIFCEFYYCIYNKASECILKTISVSPQGFCDDCLTADIDNSTLEKLKKETLDKSKRSLPVIKKETL